MPRNGRSAANDPGRGDVYTLLDGSRWEVLGREGDRVKLEALKTSVVRVWEPKLSRLLASAHGWRGAGR